MKDDGYSRHIEIADIERIVKILKIMVMAVVLIVSAALVVLQIPFVQTTLSRYAVSFLEEKMDGRLELGAISIRPFNTLVLKDVAVLDSHPAPGCSDTLALVPRLSASFRLLGLLGGEGLHLGSARLEDAVLNLVIENETTNLERIFGLEKNPEKEKNMSDIFDVRKVEISGFRFTMKSVKEKSVKEKSAKAKNAAASAVALQESLQEYIDWDDLDVRDFNAVVRDLAMSGGEMSGVLEHADFSEKSGFKCMNLSGLAVVGNGRTFIHSLRIQDGISDLDLPFFAMRYPGGNPDFSDFIRKVMLEAEISSSFLSFSTLRYFAPDLERFSMDSKIEGHISGTVEDLRADDLVLETQNGDFTASIDGSFKGIPQMESMRMDFNIASLSFTTASLGAFLNGWAPDSKMDFSAYAPGTCFHLCGKVKGLLDKPNIKAELSSTVGRLEAGVELENILDSSSPITIGGTLQTEDLDIGSIIGFDLIHETSLSAAFRANLGSEGEGMELAIDSLDVSRLSMNGYDYSGIACVGSLTSDDFFGTIVCNDPNLDFLFQGCMALSPRTNNAVYKFFANVGYADLNAINLDRRGLSRVRFSTSVNFNRTGKGDMLGGIDVSGLELENSEGRHKIGNISISSHNNDNIFRARFNSSFATGSYRGSASLGEFVRDLLGVTFKRELPSLYADPSYEWTGNNYDLNFNFSNTQDLMSFVMPGLYVADKTGLSLSMDSNGNIGVDLRSQRLAYKENFIRDMSAHFDNYGSLLNGRLEAGDMMLAGIGMENGQLRLDANDDHAGMAVSFENGNEPFNSGELSATAYLDRCEGKTDCHVSILPSNIDINSEEWSINPASIHFREGLIDISGLALTNGEQLVSINGAYSKELDAELTVHMDRFSIAFLNALTGDDLSLRGAATGDAVLTSSTDGTTGLLANIVCEDAGMGGAELGTMTVGSSWNEAFKRFDLSLISNHEGHDLMRMNAWYSPSQSFASAEFVLDKLDISLAQPFLNGLFSGLGGHVSATAHAEGPLNALAVSTVGGTIKDGTLILDYTHVPYNVNGFFHMDEYGAYFDDITLSDAYGASGKVSGKLTYDHFYDLGTDLTITFRDMEVLANREEDNAGFYGDLSASGSVDISGPVSDIAVVINARTSGPGNLHIPLSGTATSGKSNLLTFKEEEKEIVIDPYEEMLRAMAGNKSKSGSNLSVEIQAVADQDIEAFIEIDKSSGNVLTGRGNGNIGLDINPSRGKFDIRGDYTINSGNYKFVALGLASRDFTIQQGSSVKFAGDIMETTLDIDAIYKTKTSISTLISDTTSVNTRKTVECGINITDKLSNPHIAFSINIPDVEPTVKAKVENALMTEDKVQKQFLSLILSNSFLPDEQSGIVNNSSVLYSNMSEIMSNQFNNILQKLEIPLDLGFNYQPNEKGNDIFDVAVSTQLFNNRVIVNGNFGNSQYSTTGSQQDFVGDLDVEIKLDKQGHLRMSLFSHSADQYTNYLDNSQRNGAGLVYQQEYDRLGQYLKNVFSKKEKNRKQAAEIDTTSSASSVEGIREAARRQGSQERKTINIKKENR